ncbi:cell division protein ZapE [Brevirhabdus sp.]|uniref:cell division protein ZapE n=1 Tax=Brevirhabdus sp. TaxID=2004514 RepID=UPI00405A2170
MTGIKEHYSAQIAAGRLDADPGQAKAVDQLQAVADRIAAQGERRGLSLFRKQREPVQGLYMWGGVGRGKSMLMDMFFASVPLEHKRRVHFHGFMQEVHAALHEARKTGVEDAIAPVAEQVAQSARLLCFDEVQITDITDAMIVGRLFEKLFRDGVVVVATSNREPGDLYKDGLNRQIFLPFIDLLRTHMQVYRLEGPRDFRQDRLAGEPRYFTPVNAEARAAIEAIWQDLTGGDAKPLTVTVKGHALRIPAFRNGIGRATFWDLCAQPLGPADYLALAGAVRVLILEDIPCLGRSNFNEARRFVTLIDALYEARVRLICSAQAQPEHLYLEGEGSFEFERTASRLREMQGADWGG